MTLRRHRAALPILLLAAPALAGCVPRQALSPAMQVAVGAEVRQVLQVWSDTASRGE